MKFEIPSADEWLKQCGEFRTELQAEVGQDTYHIITTAMEQFAESVLHVKHDDSRCYCSTALECEIAKAVSVPRPDSAEYWRAIAQRLALELYTYKSGNNKR